jgi:protein-disulfide isomerase
MPLVRTKAFLLESEAAGLQNKFWEIHDIIFENQRKLDADNILLMAGHIGLDLERFENDNQQKTLVEK